VLRKFTARFLNYCEIDAAPLYAARQFPNQYKIFRMSADPQSSGKKV